MPPSLDAHFAYIEAEYADALAHPLSARQAMLVAVLLDKFADRMFFAWRVTAPEKTFHAEDVLAFRARLREHTPALGLIFDLCAVPQRAHLVTKAIEVPIADYSKLSTADFMVSLYNKHTVQRVVLVAADGSERLAHEVIGEAMAALAAV
jgi:hypothetical protein